MYFVPYLQLVYSSLDHVFFFNDQATTEIYTLSLHDALPISVRRRPEHSTACWRWAARSARASRRAPPEDRKSTRLNSSHQTTSYAVFCLKKKRNADPFARTPARQRNP